MSAPVRPTDAEEAIRALRANEGQVVVSVGTDPEDPVCWIVHDVREDPDCRIVTTAVGGWSEGAREPVCGPDDDFLREFLSERGGSATLVLIEEPFPERWCVHGYAVGDTSHECFKDRS